MSDSNSIVKKEETTAIAKDAPPIFRFDSYTGKPTFQKKEMFFKAFDKYYDSIMAPRLLDVDVGNHWNLAKKYSLFKKFVMEGNLTKERFTMAAVRAGYNFDKANEYFIELEQIIIPDFRSWLKMQGQQTENEGEFTI